MSDETKLCGMSWNGFNINGDRKSIDEVRRLEHRSSQLELYSKAFADAIATKDAEIKRLREALEWQGIVSAPKDGTPIDLWGINHLRHDKRGERVTNVTFGTVRDWLGNDREDWQHGRGEDFEPTHWRRAPGKPSNDPDPIPDPACGMPVEVET